jgi:hypothetical protein
MGLAPTTNSKPAPLVENPTVGLVVYDGMASFTAEAFRQTRMSDPSMAERIVFIGFRFLYGVLFLVLYGIY